MTSAKVRNRSLRAIDFARGQLPAGARGATGAAGAAGPQGPAGATAPGIVFTREALLRRVWKDETFVTDRSVDTLVKRLRKKVEADPGEPEVILTVQQGVDDQGVVRHHVAVAAELVVVVARGDPAPERPGQLGVHPRPDVREVRLVGREDPEEGAERGEPGPPAGP